MVEAESGLALRTRLVSAIRRHSFVGVYGREMHGDAGMIRLRNWFAVIAASLAMMVAAPAASAVCPGPCIRDAEIEAILREFSDPLFEAAGLVASDVDIYLINDPTLNAFVGGGQNVHINTGLIIASETPEQLKGVIAHETCHMACGHMVTRSQAMEAAGNMSMVSIGLGVLALAAGAPDAGVALIGSSSQFGYVTFAKHTRSEESAADQQAVKYLKATGQSADGLLQFFEKNRYQEMLSGARRFPYFSTHPLTNERIGQLRVSAAEARATARPQSERTLDQMARMKAKLIGFLEPANKVYREYPASDLSIPARYARAISAYRVPDIGTALKEISGLIELEPDNPYFHELHGQILFESGSIKESIAPHRRSVELAPDQPLLKVNLARSLIQEGAEDKVEEAVGLIIDALARDRENAFAWHELAQAYGRQNKVGDADLATAEEAYAIGDIRRAHQFAGRAVRKLDPNTPNGRRASDIAAITDPRANGRRG